jgi:anti-sigma factor RsiW
MSKGCNEIRELLVDYADGELPSDIAAEVAKHLAQCPACQAKAKALARSLAAAQAIWQDAEETVSGTVSFPSTKKGSGPFYRYAAAAAGILVVGTSAFLWSLQSKPAPTYDQMEDSIAQAASAARILAAADIVAGQDGGKQAARGQYLLVAETYKNTPSGKEGLLRMKTN